MEHTASSETSGYLPRGPEVGELVEVATRFTGSWSRGFVVDDVEHHGYRLRRLSDGHVLPITFSAHELRADRRRTQVPSARGA
ncbi:MAG TPA: hypothetical protein VGF64_00965 [Acidimicrobiales bacterium]|jgi:hypothetical protein